MAITINESDLTGLATSTTRPQSAPPGGNWLNAMFYGITGVFDAFSGYMLGEESARQASFESRQASRSARGIARDTATAVEAGQRGLRQFTGAQRTAIAKSGVALQGSAEQALAESELQGTMDILALKHRGKIAEIEKRFIAESQQVESKYARRLGTIGAFRTLLNTAVLSNQRLTIR